LDRCIYSLVEFEAADAEHVLQNFLGARWTSKRIVSNEVQAAFGRTIDAALESSLRPIRNLFGAEGGRGGLGLPLRGIQSVSGEVYDFEPGFVPRLQRPSLKTVELPDGRKHVRLKLGSDKQVPWALHLIGQEFPGVLIDEQALRSFARSVSESIQGKIRLDIEVGGDDYFRGILKSCFNLLAASFPSVPFEKSFDPLREFVLTGSGKSSLFVRWPASPMDLPNPRLGPIDHVILIVSRGTSVEGIIKLFGGILHSFRLSDSYQGDSIQCSYVVDPLRQVQPSEQRQPNFSPEAVPVFADQSPVNSSQAQAAFSHFLSRIMEAYYQMSEAPNPSAPADA
jgi:hypothetical protein